MPPRCRVCRPLGASEQSTRRLTGSAMQWLCRPSAANASRFAHFIRAALALFPRVDRSACPPRPRAVVTSPQHRACSVRRRLVAMCACRLLAARRGSTRPSRRQVAGCCARVVCWVGASGRLASGPVGQPARVPTVAAVEGTCHVVSTSSACRPLGRRERSTCRSPGARIARVSTLASAGSPTSSCPCRPRVVRSQAAPPKSPCRPRVVRSSAAEGRLAGRRPSPARACRPFAGGQAAIRLATA